MEKVFFFDGVNWQPCEVLFYDGVTWQPCDTLCTLDGQNFE